MHALREMGLFELRLRNIHKVIIMASKLYKNQYVSVSVVSGHTQEKIEKQVLCMIL